MLKSERSIENKNTPLNVMFRGIKFIVNQIYLSYCIQYNDYIYQCNLTLLNL